MLSLARRPLSSLRSRPRLLHSLAPVDLAHFASILPPSAILSAPAADLAPYNNDWMGKYRGQATTVLKPKTTHQVSQIVQWCNHRRIPIVPQGGNTGLVGGSVPTRDELILSLANMNRIRSFDPVSGVLVADAGCILQSLTDHVAPHNHVMPIDLGAKGSCQIGGNVATNAGGLRLLRYGSLHGTVLGLEVVLPDGTILDQLSTLRKDNTGYDLKQLFIGSEGTLGVITAVSILTPPAPQASNNVILALPSFKNVLPLYQIVKRQLSEILSAFEYIDRTAYDLAVKHGQGRALSDDEVDGADCFVLVETSGGRREHDAEKLSDLLESLMTADEPLITNGVMSQSPAQFSSLWALREGVTEASSDPEYAWVTRHTWQSWRERYKKNAERLDKMIAAIVDRKKPAQGEKGQYGYVRQPEAKPKRTRKKRTKLADAQAAMDELGGAIGMQVPVMPMMMGMQHELQAQHALQHEVFTQLAPHVGTPVDRSSVRRSPAEEEMDEEASEWMVRIGDAEPPQWAKRKPSEELEGTDGTKRARTSEPEVQPELTPQALVAIANIHVIDQGIRDIAKEFRFTVEEVQEYYDKCGEMGRTRNRFQKMREQLAKFAEDE
ncbi:hypothetical protein C0993_007031 [Termitomyces sp. T159_Od127]|nr:hypothetical protein C0993_007031 [Termitomyces sp. T159_Od127]